MKRIFVPLLLVCAFENPAFSAQVDVSRNASQTNGASLKQGSVIPEGSPVSTGSNARLQLAVGNNGGVIRAGSKTDVVLASEKNLSLSRGIMLASSGGSGFGRESITVETPETRSTVKGTMLVAYQPKSYIKVTCIEGRVSIRLKAVLGEIISLQAGQMAIINPAEKDLPEVVEVDLQELTATSALMGNDFPALSLQNRINRAAGRQIRDVQDGGLVETNLLLTGAGPALSLQRGIEGQREPEPEAPAPPPEAERIPPPRGEGGGGGAPPVVPPEGYIIDETTLFAADALTTPGFATITALTESSEGEPLGFVYNFPATEANLPELLIRNAVQIPGSGLPTIYHAEGLMQIGDGNSTTVTAGGPMTFAALHLRVNDATVQNGPDSGYDLSFIGDRLEVTNSSLLSGGYLFVSATDSMDIIGSALEGTSVAISSGLNPTTVSDSTIDAGDEISIIGSGAVSLVNNTIDSGEGIFIGSLPGGNALTISGSTLTSAADSISIYSFDTNPEINGISIDGSSLNAPSGEIFIGGGTYRGGISISASELNAGGTGLTGGINVETGDDPVNGVPVADAGTIAASNTRATANSGNIHFSHNGNNSSRTGISVINSSQLRALAAGGSVYLTTAGARIVVSDSLLEASSSGGQILMDTMVSGQNLDSLITLNNVTANADIIRARSYNSGGRDALVINGGTFNAASLIRFYAEGTSRLRFSGNVQLNTPEAQLAGRIVEVDAGGSVRASRNVRVYADDHRYNRATFGTIEGGSDTGVQSRPFTERPGF